jgi:membrane protein implicated in regulation of membrane protease activity
MLASMDPGWLWLIGGVLVVAAEIVVPGVFLIWLGIAAILTGLFTLLFGIGLPGELALFALYSIISVLVGRRVYGASEDNQPDPLLNDRAARLVGRRVLAVTAIDEDEGRVRIGDSEWSARGGPAEPGERVRITSVDGNCVIVEAERL